MTHQAANGQRPATCGTTTHQHSAPASTQQRPHHHHAPSPSTTPFCQASWACRLADSCQLCVRDACCTGRATTESSDYSTAALHALAVSQAISTFSRALAGLLTGWLAGDSLTPNIKPASSPPLARLPTHTHNCRQYTADTRLAGWLAVSGAYLQPADG